LVLLTFILAAPITWSQSIVTGGISGVVTDPTGAGVAGASLTMRSLATGETFNATSSSNGEYQFALLKPGDYKLSVTKDGFKTLTQTVSVLLGQNSTIGVKLEVGSVSSTVEVNAAPPLLQTENANIATTVDSHTVQNVPNPGNDLTYVAQTAPGVSMNTTSGNGYGNFSAFGLPGTSNLFTINGNDYNDPFLNLNNSGASNLLLGTNDVQEVAVVSNGYTGQYGRQAGAQINYTSKSGSNSYHGSANYFYTGSTLNAEDFFLKASSQPKPFQNNNQWQASFGGPIIKDKLFFFADNEGLRYVFATSSQAFLPTPAFQSYTLAHIPASAQSLYQQAFALYNGVKGIANAKPVAPGSSSCPSLPGGATCLESIFAPGSSGNQEWLIIGRADYNLGKNDTIFGRVKFDRGTQPTYADPINPAFNAISHQPQNEGQLNWTHVFNPSIVNNGVFSYLSYSAVFQSVDVNKANATFPQILCSSDSSMSCLGAVGGLFPFAFFFPQGRNVDQWQIVDDLSIAKDRHNFKMGVNFRRDNVSDFRASELTNPPAVNTSLIGFATDTVDTSTSQNFALSSPQPLAIYSFGLYFQDEIRVSPKLKLTLAIRADRNSGGVCQSNCVSVPTSPFQNLSHDVSIPFNQMVTTGRSNILRSVENVVFEPRIGFAWSPLGNNTVIRGGVGLFTDLYPGTILDNFTTNFPEVVSFSVPGGSVNPTDPGSGVNLVRACNSAFQTAFNTGQTVAQYQAAAPNCAAALPPLFDVTAKTLNPKFVEWNLELQRSFGASRVLSLNYVGNHGYNILLINPYLNGFGAFAQLPAAVPDARVAAVQQLTNNGYSNYHGVTASLQQNLWHGLTGRISYSYSHALDNVSNGGILPYSLNQSILLQIDPTNPNLSYGSADYDQRHLLSANYVWDLPLKSSHSLLNQIIGGWTVSGTFFYRTGFPFSIVDGGRAQALSVNNLVVNGAFLANVLYKPNGSPTNFGAGNPCLLDTANPCFSTTSLTRPTDFSGASSRNAFRGPSYFNTDLSLKKAFKITERFNFALGANAFNVLNHPNFQNPQSNNLSSSFGNSNALVVSPTTPYGAFASAAEGMKIVQVFGRITF
jgi:outer membrane receptor protein involved in Fe transport